MDLRLMRFILCLVLLFFSSITLASNWQSLQPGLEYIRLTPQPNLPWAKLHAFKIDLKRYRLGSVLARDLNKAASSVSYLGKHSKALIAVNGGFFTPSLQPLGLRAQDGVVRVKLRPTSWWGVFYTVSNRAYLVMPKRYRHGKYVDFAVQGGPRLIINGRIPALKPGMAERTALCVTKNGPVIILATEQLPLTTTDLAKIMQGPDFGCVNALNLDGGRSSQMYAQVGKFALDVPGFSQVTDAVIVTQR